jgi:DNA polymerase
VKISRSCWIRLLELIDPPLVATLGGVALEALKLIQYHEFTLREHAGTVQEWNGRRLVPLYHPSPQVIAAQRGLATQLSHFQTLGNTIANGIDRHRKI